MSRTQNAVLVKKIGSLLEPGVRNIPSPGKAEVLIKNTATMLLPHDTYGRDLGILIDKKLPAVLGANVAGIIEEVGEGVAWEVGTRVFGICYPHAESSDQGGLQEYSTLNANAIGRIPDSVSDEAAVTLPINIVTSWTVLFTKAGFNIPSPFDHGGKFENSSTSVVIIGGGTNVGQLAVQLARIAGLGKIVVVAGSSNFASLISMGATHVIDRHHAPSEIAQKIHAITGQDGVTQLYNCAPLDVSLVIACLPAKETSRMRVLLPLEKEEVEQLELQRPLCDFSFLEDLTNDFMAPHTEEFWANVPLWLKSKKILSTEYEVIHGLDKVKEINEALDKYRDFARAGAQTVIKI